MEKAPQDRGLYLHPDVFNQPPSKGIDFRHNRPANRVEQVNGAEMASGH
jgi:hypothetical protein